MDIYGNKLGNHALPNIFLSFCPSLSPVDTLKGETITRVNGNVSFTAGKLLQNF